MREFRIHLIYQKTYYDNQGYPHSDLKYLKTIEGVFQAPETYEFLPLGDAYHLVPQIGVVSPSKIYVLVRTDIVRLICIENGVIVSNAPVHDTECQDDSVPRMVIDHDGLIHVYYQFYDRDVNMFLRPRAHFTSSDGVNFTLRDYLTRTFDNFEMMEPVVLSDNSILACEYLNVESEMIYLAGYYQIDRGLGYGNPDYAGDWGSFAGYYHILPCVRYSSSGDIWMLLVDTGQSFSDLKLKHYSPEQLTEPYVVVYPFDTFFCERPPTVFSHFRVVLDLYNPTPDPVQANLVVVTEISIAPGVYCFISDRDGFPTFQTEYSDFPLTLPSGWWIQNLPVLDMPMDDLSKVMMGSATWEWWGALLNPETGELIGDLSYRYSIVD